jgi:membrane protease YdiL (CAAX protease family)
MPEEPPAASQKTSAAVALETPVRADARRRWFELALVMLVAFGGSILSSVWKLEDSHAVQPRQGISYTEAVFQELTILLLLGYVLSRRHLRIRDLGLRFSLRDIAAGLGVWVVSVVMYYAGGLFVGAVLHALFRSPPASHTAHEVFGRLSWQVIPLILVNPFFEELTVRAYLMSEIKALTGSWTLAIATSVAVQTAYHLYYGWYGALTLSFSFLVLALYYAWRRRAAPIILAHGIQDVLGFALLLR